MVKSINLWERSKRITAHLFGLETKGEIKERFEKLAEEEIQAQLKIQHQEHVRQLAIEYAEQIRAWEEEQEELRRQEEEERHRQEMIQLYKENRLKYKSLFYGEEEETASTEE